MGRGYLVRWCLLHRTPPGFAWAHDGQPIPPEHGGPVRLIIPQLYAWKSAKWVKGVRFLDHDEAGFWEEGGYHMRGVPWGPGDGERFRWS